MFVFASFVFVLNTNKCEGDCTFLSKPIYFVKNRARWSFFSRSFRFSSMHKWIENARDSIDITAACTYSRRGNGTIETMLLINVTVESTTECPPYVYFYLFIYTRKLFFFLAASVSFALSIGWEASICDTPIQLHVPCKLLTERWCYHWLGRICAIVTHSMVDCTFTMLPCFYFHFYLLFQFWNEILDWNSFLWFGWTE